MNAPTADLGEYSKKQHYGSRWSEFDDHIFKPGPLHPRPILRSDRTNRILLYSGSFNPPHLGHKALLRHVFENSQNINVIAALVIPTDDQRLQEKKPTGQRKFSFQQRVKLWQGYGPSDWYWVCDRESDSAWHAFEAGLIQSARRDGFKLKFVSVLGPDYADMTKGVAWNYLREHIVSDIARSADFVATEGASLKQLPGCDPWETVDVDEDRARDCANEHIAFLKRRMSLMMPSVL
ncbi:hypothetical protein H2200_013185 [Cladophialophora chaetospira]|uniref:Cytidyltransferase-like domain-containing protein n=1 Tax=Cladophialophora chaetospira TaxID=386627 RepID=A0AA39CBJ4_9EURO|nr:hypothetical protein H2200_013185 [Cladophialophora chaetospira]